MDLENSITGGTDLASTVGRRRDEVCESLLKLALDLCDDHSVTIEACTLESLAALVQLFTGAHSPLRPLREMLTMSWCSGGRLGRNA